LKFEDQILDVAKLNFKPTDLKNRLIEEIEISTEQITDYNVNYYKNYLVIWLDNNKQIYHLAKFGKLENNVFNSLRTIKKNSHWL
jgi:hypothetical protein